MTERKTGTREWSDYSINICRGCSHACRYCYARQQALRFGRIDRGSEWQNETINWDKVRRSWQKRSGRGMFPTTHDMTLHSHAACQFTLRTLLEAGNEILITTKPRRGIVGDLCDMFTEWRDQITWRFTITHSEDSPPEIKRWEPYAPGIRERMDALKIAVALGYETSVSMEPLLDPARVGNILKAVLSRVTDTVWIGAMRNVKVRTAWMIEEDIDVSWLEGERERLASWQTPEKMREVFGQCSSIPQVRWKDSYQQALGITATGEEAPDATV